MWEGGGAVIWLLLAHMTLATGERVDVLVSVHDSEAACVEAIPPPRPGQRGRRYDCRPLTPDPWRDVK